MRRDAVFIFLTALAANFAYMIASNGDYLFPDSFTYLGPARYLLRGAGFLTEPGVAETIRTPVYPLLLIPFLSSLALIVALQHLLNAFLAVWIARRFDSRLAGLLFAVDPPTIHYANKVLTESLFTIVLFAVFVLALETRRVLLCGFLCGVLVLIRPVAIVWFVPLALFFILRRIAWRRVAAFCALALVLPLAWASRNAARTGVFTVSSIGGTNLLMYRAAGALAIDNEGPFKASLDKAQKSLLAEVDDRVQDEEHVDSRFDLPHAVQAKYFTRIARETIAENKLAFAQLTVRGLFVNLLDSDWQAMMMVTPVHPDVVKWSLDFACAALLVLAIAGIVALWQRDRDLALLLVITIAYFIVITAGGEAEARFRVPVVPQLAIAAAAGVELIARRMQPPVARTAR